jgi:anti-sigma factor RsiW
MSCNLEAELTAYVDGELGPAETSTVRAHLLGCADCRSTEALLRRTVQTLAALPAFEPSLGLRRTVLTKVEATPAPVRERLARFLRPGLLVPSGLLLASALGLLVATRGGRPALPPELQDGAALDVAMNYDVAANYDVLGLDSPEDVEVVAHLEELEGRP